MRRKVVEGIMYDTEKYINLISLGDQNGNLEILQNHGCN